MKTRVRQANPYYIQTHTPPLRRSRVVKQAFILAGLVTAVLAFWAVVVLAVVL